MKNLLFTIVFAFVATISMAQCGHSLFNLLAEKAGIPATEYPKSKFRQDAAAEGAKYGIVYDQSGRNNVAIIAAICNAEVTKTSNNCFHPSNQAFEDIAWDDDMFYIVTDTCEGQVHIWQFHQAFGESGWTVESRDYIPTMKAVTYSIDGVTVNDVVNQYALHNGDTTTITTVYADGSFSDSIVIAEGVKAYHKSQPDTTVEDYFNYSVFYADDIAYDTIFHYSTDTVATISAVVDNSNLFMLPKDTLEVTESTSKRVFLISDLGHHANSNNGSMSLLDLYISTRSHHQDRVGFEYVWRDLVRLQNGQKVNPWGTVGETYDRYRPYWAWYWLSVYSGDREAWILENGANVIVHQQTENKPITQNVKF